MRDDLSVLAWWLNWQVLRVANVLYPHAPHYALRFCGAVVEWNADSSSLLKQRLHARALVTYGLWIGQLGDAADSLAINDRVIAAYKGATDQEIRSHVAWAVVNKSLDLITLRRPQDAADVLEELTASLPAEDPFLAPLAQGLNNLASALSDLGRHDDEIAVHDRVAAILHERADDPELAHLFAWALVSNGIEFASRRDFARAIEAFDHVLQTWWGSWIRGPSDRLQEALAAALRHRSSALVALRQYEAALADANRVVDRYTSSATPGVQEEVAWAMLGQAVALDAVGARREALAACDSLIQRYGRSAQDQVAAAVARASQFKQTLVGA